MHAPLVQGYRPRLDVEESNLSCARAAENVVVICRAVVVPVALCVGLKAGLAVIFCVIRGRSGVLGLP